MLPSNSENQQGPPAGLPPMPVNQPQAPVPVGAPPAPLANVDMAAQYAVKAKQAITQYGNDPFRLSEALSQLKSGYLAQEHHITPNQAGD